MPPEETSPGQIPRDEFQRDRIRPPDMDRLRADAANKMVRNILARKNFE